MEMHPTAHNYFWTAPGFTINLNTLGQAFHSK